MPNTFPVAKKTGIKDCRVVIITDLDGTLLDYNTYSSEEVASVVIELKQTAVPIVFCSSKTWAEQDMHRQQLGIKDPFIVEDGSAIFIESGYFSFSYDYHREVGGYQVIELGRPYKEMRRILGHIKHESGLNIRGFGDMDAAEISRITGLDLESAELARQRSYEEILVLNGSNTDIRDILGRIEEAGLTWSRGTRFYGVSGGSNKGRATRLLLSLYHKKFGKIKSIGIGDSFNDLPMLAEVDVPVLVEKATGGWLKTHLYNVIYADGKGPRGWVQAVKKLVAI
jgi:mannosyl-3-phosphoglycerate phosphatase